MLSNGTQFIPSFVKFVQLVQNLKGGKCWHWPTVFLCAGRTADHN